ncbi:hypothetical protein ASY01nite_23970 [Acetobacter syzygii]|nr:hypothetical protein ASY01nite_23970 [Acetobacter syzygii]
MASLSARSGSVLFRNVNDLLFIPLYKRFCSLKIYNKMEKPFSGPDPQNQNPKNLLFFRG